MSGAAHGAGERLPGAVLLSVDGAGQSLLVARRRLTLGHLRSGQADLGLLADVGARHAELLPTASLGEGPGWLLAPLEGERVELAGRPLREARRLVHGDRARLGENVRLCFTVPDITSESVLLSFENALECHGAQRLVLLAPGPGGRLRIGAAAERHLRVPNLELEIELELEPGARAIEIRVGPAPGREGPTATQRCPFPPPGRVDLACGAARGSRPPFGLSLEPLMRPYPAP